MSATLRLRRVPDSLSPSWLLTLNNVRNIAAHHGRLWNRNLVKIPKLPAADRNPGWSALNAVKLFTALTICNVLLVKISPGTDWARSVRALIEAYPSIPKDDSTMGIPADWLESPLWTNAR